MYESVNISKKLIYKIHIIRCGSAALHGARLKWVKVINN